MEFFEMNTVDESLSGGLLTDSGCKWCWPSEPGCKFCALQSTKPTATQVVTPAAVKTTTLKVK